MDDIHSNNCNRLQQLFPLFYRCPLLACSLASLAAPWLLPGCCLAAAPPRESRDQPGKPGSSHGCQQPGSSQTDQDQLAAKEPSYSISTVYLQFIYSVSYSLSTVYLTFPQETYEQFIRKTKNSYIKLFSLRVRTFPKER